MILSVATCHCFYSDAFKARDIDPSIKQKLMDTFVPHNGLRNDEIMDLRLTLNLPNSFLSVLKSISFSRDFTTAYFMFYYRAEENYKEFLLGLNAEKDELTPAKYLTQKWRDRLVYIAQDQDAVISIYVDKEMGSIYGIDFEKPHDILLLANNFEQMLLICANIDLFYLEAIRRLFGGEPTYLESFYNNDWDIFFDILKEKISIPDSAHEFWRAHGEYVLEG